MLNYLHDSFDWSLLESFEKDSGVTGPYLFVLQERSFICVVDQFFNVIKEIYLLPRDLFLCLWRSWEPSAPNRPLGRSAWRNRWPEFHQWTGSVGSTDKNISKRSQIDIKWPVTFTTNTTTTAISSWFTSYGCTSHLLKLRWVFNTLALDLLTPAWPASVTWRPAADGQVSGHLASIWAATVPHVRPILLNQDAGSKHGSPSPGHRTSLAEEY